MKKLFLFAAAAAMITACSETDVLENSATLAKSNEAPVTFDVYAQRNITRAGTPGTLDNNNIGKVGFGVFGYWTKGSEYNTNATPNFMYNQKVITSESPATGTSKWSYEPVKYWPNEFGSAAISDEVDMVTFFAYAPWTEIEPTTGEIIATEDKAVKNANGEDEDITETIDHQKKFNIISVNKNNATGDPIIKYVVDTDPATSVDLLWGVAAEKAVDEYTPIDGQADGQNALVKVTPGLPFKNLVKPNDPTKDKLLFNLKHALAKIKITINYIKDDFTPDAEATLTTPDKINADETRIFVRSFTMSGFTTKGALNLNNTTAGEPLWKDEDGVKELTFNKPVTFLDGRRDDHEGAKTGEVKSEDPQGLNPDLLQTYAVMGNKDGKTIWPADQNPGVTEEEELLFGGSKDVNGGYFYVIPRNTDDAVDVTIAYDVETIDSALASKLSDDETHGLSIPNVITKRDIFDGLDIKAGYMYEVNIHIGMTSVKIDATVQPWIDNNKTDVELPDNQEPYIAEQNPKFVPAANTEYEYEVLDPNDDEAFAKGTFKSTGNFKGSNFEIKIAEWNIQHDGIDPLQIGALYFIPTNAKVDGTEEVKLLKYNEESTNADKLDITNYVVKITKKASN